MLTAVAGCTGSALQVNQGDTVTVHYTGTLENGTVFDSSEGRTPLEFEAGAGKMIAGFDKAVIGMKLNEEKTVTLTPEEAYGSYDPRNIVTVPLGNAPQGVKAGDTLVAGGQLVKVIEVRNDTVILDANHPLAGKTLVFTIKVVRIEKSTTGQPAP